MPELLIGGQWQSARQGDTRDILCPADGSLVRTVDEAGADDTDAAIAAARTAFDTGPWSATTGAQRATPGTDGNRYDR